MEPAVTAKTPIEKRRSQRERSASTRNRVIDATLRCLSRKGYASTTLSEIGKEAAVSRGALLHHFPNKTDLVAAAMQAFYEDLAEQAEERFRELDGIDIPLSRRIEIIEEVYGDHTSVRIEFMVAARTDPALAKAFLAQQIREGSEYYPELERLDDPNAMKAIISAFLLGSSLLTALLPNQSEATHALFKTMVEDFVRRS